MYFQACLTFYFVVLSYINSQAFIKLSKYVIVRNRKYIGDIVWASLWNQRIPYGGCSHTKSNANLSFLEHSHGIYMVLHSTHSHIYGPRSQHIYRNRGVQQMDDPNPLCLWPPSISKHISANTKHCLSNNDNIRDHRCFPHHFLLASCH